MLSKILNISFMMRFLNIALITSWSLDYITQIYNFWCVIERFISCIKLSTVAGAFANVKFLTLTLFIIATNVEIKSFHLYLSGNENIICDWVCSTFGYLTHIIDVTHHWDFHQSFIEIRGNEWQIRRRQWRWIWREHWGFAFECIKGTLALGTIFWYDLDLTIIWLTVKELFSNSL